MRIRAAVRRSIVLAALGAFVAPVGVALAPMAAYAYDPSDRYFDREEIEQLTAPIALYPDPLLAQILIAAAYPEEIAQARRYMDGRNDWSGIDRQDWDYSVRAIARYPEVLYQLAGDLDWTEALGIANINQPDDVADAIQRWRLRAHDLGNLRSGSQQLVYVDDGYVRIVPAEPDYFYVPQYDPYVVYVDRYTSGYAPFIFFGPRYSYGSWFDRDWDWRQRRICYTDRNYWRNGKPVFYPQFDRVHVDRNRHWQPDRRRFKPPEKPKMPPRFERSRIPSPPPDLKPGVRRDNDRRDGDRRDQPGLSRPATTPPGVAPPGGRIDRDRDDNKAPTVRRGGDDRNGNDRSGDDKGRRGEDKPQFDRTPQPRVNPPSQQPPPPRVEQPRKTQMPAPTKVEQPRRPERQPVRTEPPKRVEQPRAVPQKVEQPKVQQAPPQRQRQQQAPPPREEEQQPQRGPRR